MGSFGIRVVSRAFVAVGVAFATAPAGNALDFSSANLIYEESYVGETGYPTTPEVDLIGAGGLSPLLDGGAVPPTIADGEAAVALSTPPSSQAVGSAFPGAGVGTSSIGLRGWFNDLDPASPEGQVNAGVQAFYPVEGGIAALVTIQSMGGGSIGALTMFDGLSGSTSLPLGAAQVAAILAGTPFTVDLFVDRGAALASGSLDMPGFPTVSDSLPIASIGMGDALSSGGSGGSLQAGVASTAGFDLDRLRAYSALGGPPDGNAFFYQLDSAGVVGNASGGAGCSSGFASSLEGWTQNNGDPVAAGGFAVFQDPAAPDDLFSSVYDLALEQEVLAGPGACILSAGDGDATLTTEWVNHVPELPGGFYGLQLAYAITPTQVEATTLVVRNLDAAVAAELGVAPGLQLAQTRLLLDATDPNDLVLLGPVQTQTTPLAEAQLAGATGDRVFLRLSYDELSGSVVGSYSLDGEASYASPFTPLPSNFPASPFPGLFFAIAGAVQSTGPPSPLSVPSLSPLGGAVLLAGLLFAGAQRRKRGR